MTFVVVSQNQGRGEKLSLGWRISVSSLWEPTLWQSTLIRLKIQLYPRVVHQIMLVEHGVHLIENLFLDELVRDKIYEFLFVLATPKLKGGSAFPVEPVAII